MTVLRLRLVLAAFALMVGLGSIIALATQLGAAGGEHEPSIVRGVFGSLLNVVDPQYAQRRALAATATLKLQPGSRQPRDDIEQARSAVADLLAWSPTDAELWTVQARLTAALRGTDQQVADMLKMSYFTAPSNFALMPDRLDVATTTKALSDPVLDALAEGDVRAILLKRADLSNKLVESYRRSTEPGRAFLVRTTTAIDPQFRLDAPR